MEKRGKREDLPRQQQPTDRLAPPNSRFPAQRLRLGLQCTDRGKEAGFECPSSEFRTAKTAPSETKTPPAFSLRVTNVTSSGLPAPARCRFQTPPLAPSAQEACCGSFAPPTNSVYYSQRPGSRKHPRTHTCARGGSGFPATPRRPRHPARGGGPLVSLGPWRSRGSLRPTGIPGSSHRLRKARSLAKPAKAV